MGTRKIVFPKAAPEGKLAQLFLNSLNFQCPSPVVGTQQVTQDRSALEFLPGKGYTMRVSKGRHVATVPFSLSRDAETFLEGAHWDSCSHSGRTLTPNLPLGSKFTVMIR